MFTSQVPRDFIVMFSIRRLWFFSAVLQKEEVIRLKLRRPEENLPASTFMRMRWRQTACVDEHLQLFPNWNPADLVYRYQQPLVAAGQRDNNSNVSISELYECREYLQRFNKNGNDRHMTPRSRENILTVTILRLFQRTFYSN